MTIEEAQKQAFERNFEKKNKRDKDRHKNNEKLK